MPVPPNVTPLIPCVFPVKRIIVPLPGLKLPPTLVPPTEKAIVPAVGATVPALFSTRPSKVDVPLPADFRSVPLARLLKKKLLQQTDWSCKSPCRSNRPLLLIVPLSLPWTVLVVH